MRDVTEALEEFDQLPHDLQQIALEYLRELKKQKGAA